MHRSFKLALVALPLLAGCSDWLSGPKLDSDPNRPTTATRNVLLTAVQSQSFLTLTGGLARNASIFTQQLAGTASQYQNYGTYQLSENDFYQEYASFYGGGGLLDIREIRRQSEAVGDRTFEGVAKVWEALIMGTAADVWGDIIYSEAVGDITTPALDDQYAVYAALQSLLDEAIADLESGEGAGPGGNDLIYGGDADAWIEAAYTLKARLFLHTAERQGTAPDGTPAFDQQAYVDALAAAQNGISAPANDFLAYASDRAGEQNIWYQFMRDRSDNVRAGAFLVDLLETRTDPRLAAYFRPAGNGEFGGAEPGEGYTPQTQSTLSAERGAADFQQPILTWAENQLIIAEAQYRLGNEPAARQALDAARQAAGLGPVGALSGLALLEAIMTEKYIALFQNIESWNDYKRTCLPAIASYDGEEVPGRLYYPNNERNTNPNIPAPNTGTNGWRNRNDPNACQ
jgi:hypothetical protein